MFPAVRVALAFSLLASACTDPSPGDDMGDIGEGEGEGEGEGSGSGSGSGSGVIPEPEPEPGYINVVVTSPYTGELQPDRRVIFSAPDGTVVSDTVTNAQGVATAQLDEGYVTIVRNGSTGPSSKIVHTVLDVKAGDTVRFGPDPGEGSGGGYAMFTHDAIPPEHAIRVHTPCESSYTYEETTHQVQVRPNARCNSNIPVISTAGTYDQATFSHIPQLFSVASGKSMTAGGTIAMPAWTPALTTQFSITGIPSGVNIQYGMSAMMIVGGTTLFDQYKSNAYAISGTSTTTWKRPQAFGDNFLFWGTWRDSTDSYLGLQNFAIKTTLSDTLSFPYTSTRARWLLRPYVQVSQTMPPKLVWAGEGTDDADVGWIGIGYGNTTHGVAWSILGPAPTNSAGTITLPRLPDDLQLLYYDSISKARIAVIAADGASYADLRERIAHVMDNAIELDWYDSGTSGVVRELVLLPNVNGARMSMSPRP